MLFLDWDDLLRVIDVSGWPQTWKTWKTQGIWKIVKISRKTHGNLNFCRKNLENSRKIKLCDMIANKNAFHRSFLSWVARGKKFKMPWKSQGKLREFCFSKMWPPCLCSSGRSWAHLTVWVARHTPSQCLVIILSVYYEQHYFFFMYIFVLTAGSSTKKFKLNWRYGIKLILTCRVQMALVFHWYRSVFDVVMHSNKVTGPWWRIYSKTVITSELVRDIVIWKIVPCN